MLPTLFLLTGSLVAPSPFQLRATKTGTFHPLAGQRMPEANGPDAIFLKYTFEPVPMGGWGLNESLYLSPEERLQRQENLKRRLKELEKLQQEMKQKKQQGK